MEQRDKEVDTVSTLQEEICKIKLQKTYANLPNVANRSTYHSNVTATGEREVHGIRQKS